MDGLVQGQGMEAVQAVGPLVKFVRLFVVGRGLSHQSTTATAAGIVVVEAILAQWSVGGACIFVLPDPLAAIATEQSIVVQALGAQILAIEVVQQISQVCSSFIEISP